MSDKKTLTDRLNPIMKGMFIAFGEDGELSPRKIIEVVDDYDEEVTVVLAWEDGFDFEKISHLDYTYFREEAACRAHCEKMNAEATDDGNEAEAEAA